MYEWQIASSEPVWEHGENDKPRLEKIGKHDFLFDWQDGGDVLKKKENFTPSPSILSYTYYFTFI